MKAKIEDVKQRDDAFLMRVKFGNQVRVIKLESYELNELSIKHKIKKEAENLNRNSSKINLARQFIGREFDA